MPLDFHFLLELKLHTGQAAEMAPKRSSKGVKKMVRSLINSLMTGEVGLPCHRYIPTQLTVFLPQQASMKAIYEMVKNLLYVPSYLVPQLSCKYDSMNIWPLEGQCSLNIRKHLNIYLSPRPSILDLAQRFESSKGWALERTFVTWMNRQPWRKCLPPIYESIS